MHRRAAEEDAPPAACCLLLHHHVTYGMAGLLVRSNGGPGPADRRRPVLHAHLTLRSLANSLVWERATSPAAPGRLIGRADSPDLVFFGYFTQKSLNFLEIQPAVHPSLSKSFSNKPLKFSVINTQSTTLPPATAARPMSRPLPAARREASPDPAQAH